MSTNMFIHTAGCLMHSICSSIDGQNVRQTGTQVGSFTPVRSSYAQQHTRDTLTGHCINILLTQCPVYS